MKKTLCILLVAAMAMILSGLAVASAQETLDGRKFMLIQDGRLYSLEFFQGAFGPGENGTLIFTDELSEFNIFEFEPAKIAILNYSFQYPPFCIVQGTIELVLKNGQLKMIPADAPKFDEVVGGD